LADLVVGAAYGKCEFFNEARAHCEGDTNGKVPWLVESARLLMKLNVICGGYPPVAVRPQDRLAYVRALQQAQPGQGSQSFDSLLIERLDATLAECLSAFERAGMLARDAIEGERAYTPGARMTVRRAQTCSILQRVRALLTPATNTVTDLTIFSQVFFEHSFQ
jgi:hypothetical protein